MLDLNYITLAMPFRKDKSAFVEWMCKINSFECTSMLYILQLAIDREVIALIKKTRLELKKIREKYVKRCNLPFQSVGVVNNKPLPLAFTSRLVNED